MEVPARSPRHPVPPPPQPAGLDGTEPLCPDGDWRSGSHNLWEWHPLYDAARDCHYNHAHGMDPDDPQITAIFGDHRQHTGGDGISYAWATNSGAAWPPTEQTDKHNGYWVEWREGEPCMPVWAQGCVVAWRMQYHAVGANNPGNIARFHSFLLEARVCLPDGTTCGNFVSGGHIDVGALFGPYQGTHVPMPDDPPLSHYNCMGPPVPQQCWPYRAGEPAPSVGGGNLHQEQWVWGGESDFGFSPYAVWDVRITNPSDWLNTADPTSSIHRCQATACAWNGSWRGINTIKVRVPKWLDGHALDEDGQVNGFVTFHGWQRPDDSWIADGLGSAIDTSCTGPTASCAPLIYENVPVGAPATSTFLWDSDTIYSGIHPQDPPRIRSVDTSPGRYGITDGTGNLIWWIEE